VSTVLSGYFHGATFKGYCFRNINEFNDLEHRYAAVDIIYD